MKTLPVIAVLSAILAYNLYVPILPGYDVYTSLEGAKLLAIENTVGLRFLATACYARRGLSHRFAVIDIFIYISIYLFSSLTFFSKRYSSKSTGPILMKLGLKYSLEPRASKLWQYVLILLI